MLRVLTEPTWMRQFCRVEIFDESFDIPASFRTGKIIASVACVFAWSSLLVGAVCLFAKVSLLPASVAFGFAFVVMTGANWARGLHARAVNQLITGIFCMLVFACSRL